MASITERIVSSAPQRADAALVISPDNAHVAYIIESGRKFSVVRDGVVGVDYEEIDATSLGFSPDGLKLAYAARRRGGFFSPAPKWTVVLDGNEGFFSCP